MAVAWFPVNEHDFKSDHQNSNRALPVNEQFVRLDSLNPAQGVEFPVNEQDSKSDFSNKPTRELPAKMQFVSLKLLSNKIEFPVKAQEIKVDLLDWAIGFTSPWKMFPLKEQFVRVAPRNH